MLPARLRLEQRMIKRPNQGVKRFAVPVLDIEVSPAQLMSGAAAMVDGTPGTLAIERPREIDGASPLTPVPDTVPETPIESVKEQATRKRESRRRSQQQIPATGLAPRTAAQAANNQPPPPPPDEPPDETEGPPTAAMNRKMHALFRDANVTDRDDRLTVTSSILGFELTTSASLTHSEGMKLIDTLEKWSQSGELDDQIREILNAATLAAENTQMEQESNNA
jgi:hypothetical protein